MTRAKALEVIGNLYGLPERPPQFSGTTGSEGYTTSVLLEVVYRLGPDALSDAALAAIAYRQITDDAS